MRASTFTAVTVLASGGTLPVLAAVHTTGINIEAVAAIASSVVVLMSPVLALLVYLIRNQVRDELTKALGPILARLDELETRMARVEGIEEGKRFMLNQLDHAGDAASRKSGDRG